MCVVKNTSRELKTVLLPGDTATQKFPQQIVDAGTGEVRVKRLSFPVERSVTLMPGEVRPLPGESTEYTLPPGVVTIS